MGLACTTGMLGNAQDGAWPGASIGNVACGASITQTGSTYYASNDCGSRGSRDHMYNFVVTQAGAINISLCATNNFDNYLYLFDATGTPCSGALSSNNNGCPGTNSAVINNYSIGPGTYVVVIEGRWNSSRGSYQLDIDHACAPANDVPCSATNLSVGTSPNFVNGTNVAATTDGGGIPSPSCANFQNSDVWYTATVPTNGLLIIDTQTGTLTDGGMAAYTATSCSGTYELVQCDDDDSEIGNMPGMYLSHLPAGTTVYIRIWGYGSNNTGTFGITAWSPTGTCAYVLDLQDSYGDGWDGSTVGVSINGGTPTTYTVNEERNIIPIGVNVGNLVQLYYTSGGGSYENEISYKLVLMNGVVFADGPAPANGLRYTGVVDCVSPPASPEDCLGGITICSNGTFQGNTNHTGIHQDLDNSNQGCLSVGERQGTWYFFSPSHGGNIEMTISPQNASDDYDFAIWGPMSAVDCSPNGPPARCSYAAPGGDTGMQNGSGHNSENASGDKWVNGMTVQTGEVYMMYIDNWSTSSNSFDLTWNLTNGASLDCTVLPVELTVFRAEQDNSDVHLTWYTASELNNERFDIEHSLDGLQFQKIGEVDGMGSTQTATFYEHYDTDPSNGTNYYRLKQVDFNGEYSYSDIKTVNFVATGIGATEPYPNPVSDVLSIDLYATDPSMVTAKLLDATGRTISLQTVDIEGSYRLYVDLAEHPSGLYLLNLSNQEGIAISNSVVVKD